MLASALAPAMPLAPTETSSACCAGNCGAPCRTDCALPPISAARTTGAAVVTIEHRAAAAKPAARATIRFAHPLVLSGILSAPTARGLASGQQVPAASVALFQAHCSLLL